MNEEDLTWLRVWSEEMTLDEMLETLNEMAQREQELIMTTARKKPERKDYMRNLAALIRAQTLLTPEAHKPKA